MKQKIIATLMTLLLVIGLTPVLAVETSSPVDIDFETEDFAPMIYLDADGRVMTDDNVDDGRNTAGAGILQRTNNYAFEGEKLAWDVLVYDRNGIETVMDPVLTLGTTQTTGNDVEALCDVGVQLAAGAALTEFNVRDGPDALTFDLNTMRIYTCTFTVESPASMSGEFFLTAEVEDTSALSNIQTHSEFWFFNPTIELAIDGALSFGTVRPGADSYSSTVTVGNDATPGSGVLLEMFLSGTDFHDPVSSAAKCPTTNELTLGNFKFLATNGAFTSSTANVGGAGVAVDAEGYDDIRTGTRITESREIIGGDEYVADATLREAGNVLAPGAEMSVTLKLSLPNPCHGDFTDGNIFFWALAV